MNFKHLTINFDEAGTVAFENVDELAVAMNGFLVVSQGNQKFYYNFDSISSYSFEEVEDEETTPTETNIYPIN